MPGTGLIRFWGLCAALLLLAGCAHWGQRELPPLPLLPPEELGAEVQLSQRVTVTLNGESQTLLAAWAVTAGRLGFAGLTPTGQRLLALSWDGQHFEESYSGMLEQPLPGEQIIAHMQLAHWPPDSIDRALRGTDWEIRYLENDSRRELYLRNRLAFSIHRQFHQEEHEERGQPEQVPDSIDITSPVMDYQLSVTTLQVTRP